MQSAQQQSGVYQELGALMCSNTHGIFTHGHFRLLWEIKINKIIKLTNTKFKRKGGREGGKEIGKEGGRRGK